MTSGETADVVVVGSGPNGLVAAALLARAGMEVVVLEAGDTAGGAVRSERLTVAGYLHDPFSAFYGLLHLSPVFAELELGRRVTWAGFEYPVAAAVDPERAALCATDEARTLALLRRRSRADAEGYARLCEFWRRSGGPLVGAVFSPLPPLGPALRLAHGLGMRGLVRLGATLLTPIDAVAARHLETAEARALVACGATHADVPVDAPGSLPMAMVLALAAQRVGMPVPVGGAGRLAEALVDAVTDAGGRVMTGREATRVRVRKGRACGVETAGGGWVTARRAVVADCDVGSLALGLLGPEHLPASYLEGLRRRRHGSGVLKLDLALTAPAPWRAEGLGRSGVVHLCGDLEAMARSQHEVAGGRLPERPLLVVGQQSLADPGRAPAGAATLWVECHVPTSPAGDAAGRLRGAGWEALRPGMVERVLDHLEEHAPGLRSSIAGLNVRDPAGLAAADPNLVGGDIGGGSAALDQQLLFRPVPGWGGGHRLPVAGLYLCSSSAHPGGGVHGICGRNCARAVLADGRPLGRLLVRGRGGLRGLEARRPLPPVP